MKSHIPTLEETLAEQNCLERLCQDRTLETAEIFKPNAYYGMDFIIKKYSNIAFNTPLKVILPHGINTTNKIWSVERKALLPIIYNYSPFRYPLYNKYTNKIILHSAAPYVYLSEMLKADIKPKRTGTIFFPAHSSHHVTASMDYKKLADNLELLEEKYKPITICIYWRDYNLNTHKVFEQRGFKIVSAGHMFDPLFLFRLHQLCSLHKYAACNKIGGSSLFYAVKAGCSYFIIHDKNLDYKTSENILRRDCLGLDYHKPTYEVILKLFDNPLENISDEQRIFVDEFLGSNYLKSPLNLKAELLFADRLDKYGFAQHPETKKNCYKIPNFIPRKLLRDIKNKLTS